MKAKSIECLPTHLVNVDEYVVELGELLAAHARHHLLVVACRRVDRLNQPKVNTGGRPFYTFEADP